jgi:hypothetical protein
MLAEEPVGFRPLPEHRQTARFTERYRQPSIDERLPVVRVVDGVPDRATP